MVSSAISNELLINFLSSAATTTIVPGTDGGNSKILADRKPNQFCSSLRKYFFKLSNQSVQFINTIRNTSKMLNGIGELSKKKQLKA